MTVVDNPAAIAEPVSDETTLTPTMSRAPGRSPGLAVMLGRACAVVGAGIGAQRLGDNSFLTHLATGREMLEDGIIRSDQFTWTAGGKSVVVQSWLASLLYGVTDAVAGLGGIRILIAAISALLAWLVWRLTASASSPVTRIVIVAPVLYMGVLRWSERPQLLAFVAVALTLLAVDHRFDIQIDVRWLALVGVVWVNVHGSWPLGLVLVASMGLGEAMDRRQTPRRELDAFKWLAGGMLVGGIVNPYGPALLVFPIQLLGRQDTLQHITEWQSPTFIDNGSRLLLVMIAMTMGSLVRRPSWRAATPDIVFVLAALMGQRNMVVASIVLVPLLARGLPPLGSVDSARTSPAIRMAAMVFAVLIVLIPLAGVRPQHVDLEIYPVAAVDALVEAGNVPGNFHLIHNDVVGNYLDVRFGATNPSWIDDRYELHADGLVDDYLTLLGGTAEWADVLARWDADALLWPASAPLTQLVVDIGGWTEWYRDDVWVIACRVDCGPRPIVDVRSK